MGDIKQWAIALCAAAIGCTILKSLAPKNGTGRLFHLMIAAFFLCCMAAPLLSLRSLSLSDLPAVDYEEPDSALSERVEEQMIRQMETTVKGLCDRFLKNYDVTVEKVTVHTDTSADGRIYISHVTLFLDKQNVGKSLTVRQIMEQQLGVTVDVETLDD